MKRILYTLIFHSLFILCCRAEIDSSHWNSEKPEVGNYLATSHMLYSCRPYLSPYGFLIIDEVAAILHRYPGWSFCVEVHSDCRAGEFYNLEFTQRWAQEIKLRLVFMGIEPERIHAVGVGEYEPLVPKCSCDLTDPGNRICTEYEHQQNRAILFRLDEYSPFNHTKFKIQHQTAVIGNKQFFQVPVFNARNHSFADSSALQEIRNILLENAEYSYTLTFYCNGSKRRKRKTGAADSSDIHKALQSMHKELPYPDMIYYEVKNTPEIYRKDLPNGILMLEIRQYENRDIDLQNPKTGQVREIPFVLYNWSCKNPWHENHKDSNFIEFKQLSGFELRIESYSDCRASETYNQVLTQARADTIRSRMARLGLDTSRISTAGYGENKPRLPNCRCELTDAGNIVCTEQEHQLNRRILVRLVTKR